MKRLALATAVVITLFSGVLLVRAAWRDDAGAPVSPIPTVSATGPLDSAAAWQYRHNQPTHWRSCMVRQ